MANTDVYDVAQTLLDSVNDYFGAASVGLPGRQYVHAGEIADDCDQLVVSFQRLHLGTPGNDRSGEVREDSTITAEFEVRLTRCVPTLRESGQPPGEDPLTVAAETVLTDAWLLARSILAANREHDFGVCKILGLSGALPIGPQGTAGGISMTVTVGMT